MTNRFLTKQRSLNTGNRFVATHRGGTLTRSRGLTENADLENDTNEVWEGPATFAQSLTVSAHCPLNRASDASTEHFRLSEFNSRDGEEVPEALRGNVQEVMNNLEVLRAELGEPITVGSGYRSPAHNRSVGGKPRSQHLCGRAADITVVNYTPRQVHAKIEELITAGRMTQGGLGLYRNFVHYDVRGTRQRWDESNGETAPAVRRPASSTGPSSTSPTSGAASALPRQMTHTISQRGIDMIKEFEGFRGNLYNDPAGHCTIGYGHLVHRGRCDGSESAEFRGGISEARALELFREKLNTFELAVNDAVTVRMNSNQYAALVSFCYNIGTGAFRGSTLLRKLNQGNYAEVPAEMRRWNKAGGNVLPGLVRRREREAALFAEQPSTSQSLSGGQMARSTFQFESPSPFTSRSMGMYSSQMSPVLIAGITVSEAIQIGLGAAAMVQTGVSGTQGSFTLTYDTAQRLLTSEARAQMPGSHATKQPYSRRLLYLPQIRAGTAYAEVIIEWEGNPFGEISTPVIRRDLSTSSDFERSSANIAIRKIESIPNTSIDPRAWPIVYSYEGTYDPLGTGHWEFTGEFEINAFGGLKFNRHQVVSRSLIDYPGSSPQSYVQKGQDHIPAIPTIPQEQVDYLRSRLP